MSNVIPLFPRTRRIIKQRPPVATAEEDGSAKHARYAKYNNWRSEQRRWGGGHRKRAKPGRSNAPDHWLADIYVDKHAWREPAYRTAMANNVLEVLFKNRRIGIGFGTPRLYWFSGGNWKHLSDRWVNRMLARYFNFTRDGETLQPPRWLPEALRFAAYNFLDGDS